MNRIHLMSTVAAAACLAAGAARAQDSAVANAGDAFGERVGVEQVGLYDEGQVRGFDLQGGGAYRVDGAYFVRAVFLPDPVLDGVSVRVGVNAARLDYPSPSGVVNYRLRDPGDRDALVIGVGLRPHQTPFLDVRASEVSDDGTFAVTGNIIARPDVTWDGGTNGQAYDMGVVARWRPSDRLGVRAFASYARRDYDGDYGVIAVGGALPPTLPPLMSLGPRWGDADIHHFNTGALVDARVAGWAVNASVFRSMYLPERADFTLVRAQPDGAATATVFLSPDHEFVSDSMELRASRVFASGPVSHRVAGSIRGRFSHSETGGEQAFDLGPLTLDRLPIYPDEPARQDDGRRNLDDVEQFTASLGYGLAIGGRFEARLGVHRTRYEKRFTPIGGAQQAGVDEFTLYNASAVWSLTDRLTLFGSWVTGLEEAGNAPQNAANRNEVLAPVEAEQFELGARWAMTEKLSLITAAFDVAKPTYGLRSNGVYGLVGDVRHRGLEASLTGEVFEGTSIVLGAMILDPEISGELVDNGSVGREPAGVSKVVAVASVDHRLSFAPQWSVDAQVNYSGERQVNSQNSFQAPAVTTLSLGARYRFEAGDIPGVFRVAVQNLTDEEGWWASRSSLIWPIGPRTVRASLTFTLW